MPAIKAYRKRAKFFKIKIFMPRQRTLDSAI